MKNNIIAAFTDHSLDKYSLLSRVMEESCFFEILDLAWKGSGKSKSGFRIVIKPNISMLLRRTDLDEAARKLEKIEAFKALTRGAPVPRRAPFSVPREGG